ncbi:hypothetical protein ACGFIF_41925 [Kribbella sp. NPDC049174]|uniref:hypothetical protein n=1 Tax=Kribbella sp. NPDC049174 TaxID=3364112 RepID=UPI003720B800
MNYSRVILAAAENAHRQESGAMSEQAGEDPKAARRPKQQLDRDNLPEEFTPEFLENLPPRDLVWLESTADLTPRQRETFLAWSSDRFGGIAGAFKHRTMRLLGGPKPWWVITPEASADPLGEDIRESLDDLRESVTQHSLQIHDAVHMTDSVTVELNGKDVTIPVDLGEEQLRALTGIQETSMRMTEMLEKLVERTDEQRQELARQRETAERQKLITWLLAAIAGASAVGTFFTVQGTTRIVAAIAGAIFIGLFLYTMMSNAD